MLRPTLPRLLPLLLAGLALLAGSGCRQVPPSPPGPGPEPATGQSDAPAIAEIPEAEPPFDAASASAETLALYYLASDGDPKAQMALAQRLREGRQIAQDESAAFQWIRRAAAQNHLPAIAELGLVYHYGSGTAVDHVQAARYYRQAAEAGDADSASYLGEILALGQGLPRDFAEAHRWYERAAAGDSDLARNNAAWFWSVVGDPAFQDGPRAVRLMEGLISRHPFNAGFLDTLAAAYARCGRWEDAIKTQELAVALTESDQGEEAAGMRARLDLFRAHQTYEEFR